MAVRQGQEDLVSRLGSVERPAGIEDPENISEWTNILSELLLGLLGCSGGAFVIAQSSEVVVKYPLLKLSEEVDWISEAERWVIYIKIYLL
jgi:hypothetical protein